MGFRTMEITGPAELHVTQSQLTVEKNEIKVQIPLEDISTIVCSGAGIRISTAAMIRLSVAKITMLMIDEKYRPASILLPIESNARQALVIDKQINIKQAFAKRLWREIIKSKIQNQAKALQLLEIDGHDEISLLAEEIDDENAASIEAIAAKKYFDLFHPGLNRREENPINSRLNYGYAVLRNAIIRSLIVSGFHPSIGIHHTNRFNAFNLADDMIEPWRPFVDLLAYKTFDNNLVLNKAQKMELSAVLHNACLMQGKKIAVLRGIDIMTQSFRKALFEEKLKELSVPIILPVELVNRIDK